MDGILAKAMDMFVAHPIMMVLVGVAILTVLFAWAIHSSSFRYR